ncbi:MAG: hypothetical protein ISQ11_09740 [Planctomycetes bacterium]|nr:hypothetical protein [Planctomycetota bacterium]
MTPPTKRHSLLSGLALLALASCSSSPIASISPLDPEEVPAVLVAAQSSPAAELADRQLVDTVAGLLSANKARGLDTKTRVAVRDALETYASELATRGDDPRALEDLSETDLPARISVPAGLRSATLYLERDDRKDAFKTIKKLDRRYPSHGLRDESGDLLKGIGDSYFFDKRRKYFLFPYSNSAPQVYEYLSAEYPKHPETDDALHKLSEVYEKNRQFAVAIEKHEELVLWCRDSPYRIASEAAIPRLRLAALGGPEYGRDSLKIALGELEVWLSKYPDNEIRPEVERTLVDCLQRLADNDMVVARFYRTVDSPAGARQHAARALETAKRAGNPEQLEEIRAFLEAVDEIESLGPPRQIPQGNLPQEIVPLDGEVDQQGPAELAPGSGSMEPRRIPRRTERAIEQDEKEEQASGAAAENSGGQQ